MRESCVGVVADPNFIFANITTACAAYSICIAELVKTAGNREAYVASRLKNIFHRESSQCACSYGSVHSYAF